MDINLKNNAEDLCKIMEPISTSLDKLQSGNSSISNETHSWKELLKKNISDDHIHVFFIYHQALTHYHLLAYLINPKYLSEHLS